MLVRQIMLLYTWKTFVGILMCVLVTPLVVKAIETIFDWFYLQHRRRTNKKGKNNGKKTCKHS